MRRRAAGAVLFGVALLPGAYFAWASRDMPLLGRLHDDTIYWVSAQSLARGRGYRIASLPGEPYQTKYPPLYPALLSLVWRARPAFPENLPLAALAAWLALPGWLLAARLVLRDLGVREAAGALLLVVLGLNLYVIVFSVSLMPELLFSCLLMLALSAAHRAREQAWPAALAGMLGGLAFLARTPAMAMLATAPLCFLMRRQRRQAVVFVAAMLPAVAAWTVWSKAHATPSSDPVWLYYTDYLGYFFWNVTWGDLPALLWRNLDGLMTGIGGLLVFTESASFPARWALWVLALAAIAGTLRLAGRSGWTQHHWFAGTYALMLLPWHYPPHERFLLPVFPVLLAGFTREASHAAALARDGVRRSGLGSRVVAAATVALLVAVAVAFAAQTHYALARFFPAVLERQRAAARARLEAYAWAAENVPRQAAFLTPEDSLLYLYTGHKTCPLVLPSRLFFEENREAVRAAFSSLAPFAREHGLGYVLLGTADYAEYFNGRDRSFVQKMLAGSPGFAIIYHSPAMSVYRLEP